MTKTLPPGPPGLPLIGHTFEFDRGGPDLLRRAYETYGPIFTIRIGGLALVMMIGPEAHQYLLVQQAHNFESRGASSLVPLLGEGLLVIDGEKHRAQRALMTPAFHKQRISTYMETMVNATKKVVAKWQPGQVVRLFDEARYVTLDIIAQAVFGMDLGSRRDALRPQIKGMLDFYSLPAAITMLPINPPLGPWRQLRNARKRFDQIVDQAVQERRSTLESTGTDILTALVEARDEHGQGLTNQQIADQLTTLLLAGHDTTTGTFAWAVMMLCQHPEVTQRLREEQAAVLGGRLPRFEDLQAMPYLDMVVNETLRMYPPAWLGLRKAREEFSWGGYTIPAGTRVGFSEWVTHRLPQYFAAPDTFKPERFDKQHGEKYPAYTFMPFLAGNRVCIGMQFALMEIKAMLSVLLHYWEFEAVPNHKVETRLIPTLQPSNDVLITVRPAQPAPEHIDEVDVLG